MRSDQVYRIADGKNPERWYRFPASSLAADWGYSFIGINALTVISSEHRAWQARVDLVSTVECRLRSQRAASAAGDCSDRS